MYRRIQTLRKNRRLRQKDVAMMLNCTQPCYSRYEKGERNMPTAVLQMLADFYGVSTDYILGRTDQKEPYSK